MINAAVVGVGYWGPNLVRNFSTNEKCNLKVVCDVNTERLKFIKSKFSDINTETDYTKIFDNDIDLVAISTPIKYHYEIAKAALLNGKHIWVEKPFTFSTSHAEELINIAEQKKLKIFVDHTFLYTGAVRKIKSLIDSNELGTVKYFDSVRINLGLFQHDINVIWDLAPHDISIMQYTLNKPKIKAVSAHGIAGYYNHENIAHISLYFGDNSFGHIHVNWTSPVKIRKMLFGGSNKMLVYDDMENSDKIKVYDSGIEVNNTSSVHEALVQYRIGDMHSPKIPSSEALKLGVEEFLDSIVNDTIPISDGRQGLEVVRVLEACDFSIKNNGKLIYLD